MSNKMYLDGKLCVPESLAARVLLDVHSSSGHVGFKRAELEARHRFEMPSSVPVTALLREIRQACTIFQATEPPHWARERPMGSFPVPERLMHSVCLDVFAMPPVTWQEVEYDSILLCVDRLSGWLVAFPTVKQGLTAERAAHLLLDKWWEHFGLPATVLSDMGPQFVGQ